MTKFILIDHSTRGYGGHHFEYASHVLDAARAAGFDPSFAVHQSFDLGSESPPWPIIPAFEHGFWPSLALAALQPVQPSRWDETRIRVKYSATGQRAALLRALVDDVTPAEIIQRSDRQAAMMGELALLAAVRYPVFVGRSGAALLAEVFRPLQGYGRAVGQRLWMFGRELLYPFKAFGYLDRVRERKWEVGLQQAFAEGMRRVDEAVGVDENALVFIPTLSHRDMLGLARFLQAHPHANAAAWHLLFRRNLLEGRETDYVHQSDELRREARAFHQFRREAPSASVRFWTDTDRLTDQHNLLGAQRFRTLPIPTNPALRQPRSARGRDRLRVVYAGDARVEKGFHVLPHLVRTALQDPELRDRVEFVIQANFAHARPQDGADELLAREALEELNSEHVRLLREPLSSQAYLDLVTSADILLIMYDPERYYARSSGVLIEALLAGIPFLTTAGSWMAEQLAPAQYAYALDAAARVDEVSRLNGPMIDWLGAGPLLDGADLSFDGRDRRAAAFLPRPTRATHVLMSFDRPEDLGAHLHAFVTFCRRRGWRTGENVNWKELTPLERYTYEDLASSEQILSPARDADRCAMLCSAPADADSVYLSLAPAYASDQLVTAGNFSVSFLNDRGAGLATSAVAETYVSSSDPLTRFRSLVRNYEHYAATARAHAERVREWHAAEQLVRELSS